MDMEHERRLTEVESRSKSNTKLLDDMEKRQDDLDKLVATVEVLAVKESNVESDVKEIKNDVKSIKDKPGKRWDAIVDKAIWMGISAVIAYFLAKSGL
jgi:predicted  nucleic acid-binding Zn-ribbon protein